MKAPLKVGDKVEFARDYHVGPRDCIPKGTKGVVHTLHQTHKGSNVIVRLSNGRFFGWADPSLFNKV